MNDSNRDHRPDAKPPDGVLQLRVVVTETPWRSRNFRLDGPGPIHLTLFQELDTGAQP